MGKSFKALVATTFLFLMLIFSKSASAQSLSVADNAARQTYVTLNNGIRMPQFGTGTYSIPDDRCYHTLLRALKAGYRHIDTAHAYGNERAVGRAVKDCGIPRDSIWITSKLWPNEYGKGKTLPAIDRMLKRLGVDYIDLVYLHQPVGDYVCAWHELEEAQRQGKVRAIGISDFDVNDSVFHSLIDSVKVMPQALQIECHPYAQRVHWQEVAKKFGIQIECWFPLGGRDSHGAILRDSVICRIAQAHHKTPGQVILRWHIQKGFSVVPGIDDQKYIDEDLSIFDFSLSEEEMRQIAALNKEQRFFNMPYEQQKKVFGAYELWD